MSGGSWEYVCYKIEGAADRLIQSDAPARRALGAALKPFSKALHDIEWVDSGDYAPGIEATAIENALGQNAHAMILAEAVKIAERIRGELDVAIQKAKSATDGSARNS